MVDRVPYTRTPEQYAEFLKHMVSFVCSKCLNAENGDYDRPGNAHCLVISLQCFSLKYEIEPRLVDELFQFINERLR